MKTESSATQIQQFQSAMHAAMLEIEELRKLVHTTCQQRDELAEALRHAIGIISRIEDIDSETAKEEQDKLEAALANFRGNSAPTTKPTVP